MSKSFLDEIGDIEDPRIPGMVFYPLDEILLSVLVGLLCRGEDFDEIEDICSNCSTGCGCTCPSNAASIGPSRLTKTRR